MAGTFTFQGVTSDHAIDVEFEADVTPPVFHTITATAGAGGSITPGGAVQVADGADQTFDWAADPGFHVKSVSIDGQDHPELV